MEQVAVQDLGRIDYQAAWDYQSQLHRQLVDQKVTWRRTKQEGEPRPKVQHHFLFCEHPPVYTLGKSGKLDHLLLKEEELEEEGVQFYKINRGGDITFHGPGQVVGYPIFDLDHFFNDVHRYVRFIEEAIIWTLGEFGIQGRRYEGYTGVWLEGAPKRKICAIGVHLSRWVSMHGFALNVNTGLKYFEHIVPCGIQEADKTVTSMEAELGTTIDIQAVKDRIIQHFADLFQFDIVPTTTVS